MPLSVVALMRFFHIKYFSYKKKSLRVGKDIKNFAFKPFQWEKNKIK